MIIAIGCPWAADGYGGILLFWISRGPLPEAIAAADIRPDSFGIVGEVQLPAEAQVGMAIAAADVDGDGILDLVSSVETTDSPMHLLIAFLDHA